CLPIFYILLYSFFFLLFFFSVYDYHLDLHSFPTRRSSDLRHPNIAGYVMIGLGCEVNQVQFIRKDFRLDELKPGESAPTFLTIQDRKSTRLNSSHQIISYAVFCLKKKKKINNTNIIITRQY